MFIVSGRITLKGYLLCERERIFWVNILKSRLAITATVLMTVL